jgi:hypothetical protein
MAEKAEAKENRAYGLKLKEGNRDDFSDLKN